MMPQIREINIEMRTTWVLLIVPLICWLRKKWLLRLLNGMIIARVYQNNKLTSEIRFDIQGL